MKTVDILVKAFEACGLTTRQLVLGEDRKVFTQVTSPDSKRTLTISSDSPLYPFATASSRIIANSKDIAYDLATQVNCVVPESVVVEAQESDYHKAQALLEKHGRVIVKPNSSSVSNGLTLDIVDPEHLHDAIEEARRFSDRALVQQQVFGDEIRFVVIDGKVRAAMLRQTPSVFGNGSNTLQELIEAENQARSAITDTAVPYPQLDETHVTMKNLDMQYVPALDERVELGRGTMIRLGASVYDIVDQVDDSYIAIAEQLAGQVGNGFVVVDMILQDFKQPATTANYAFIEYNLTPALALFYGCRDGKHFDAAGKYLAPMIKAILERKLV